jgi:hypothetical protein
MVTTCWLVNNIFVMITSKILHQLPMIVKVFINANLICPWAIRVLQLLKRLYQRHVALKKLIVHLTVKHS